MDQYRILREEAFQANMEIPARGLAVYTWGNVSAFDPAKGVFAIKPSGVPYDALAPKSMVIVDLEGRSVCGQLKPSSDTETHRILYLKFAVDRGLDIRGITHTHSSYATAWAQAKRSVPLFGTTHADHGAGEIPCTDLLSAEAVEGNYEKETGIIIAETFIGKNIDPVHTPMVLAAGHGPFSWGKNAAESIYHAAVLEEICKTALFTIAINPKAELLPEYIARKHWERKHGPEAYYGQN